jgi:hypothetical protein
MRKTSSTAQPRQGRGLAALAYTEWADRPIRAGYAVPAGWRGGPYGELGPGFEELLDQLVEGGADEATKRHLIPNRVVAIHS